MDISRNVNAISFVGDGACDFTTYKKSCGWDGGDCKDMNQVRNRYPDCTWDRLSEINDGICDQEANVQECGFDGGDC